MAMEEHTSSFTGLVNNYYYYCIKYSEASELGAWEPCMAPKDSKSEFRHFSKYNKSNAEQRFTMR